MIIISYSACSLRRERILSYSPPANFAQKEVWRLVEPFPGHCLVTES